MKIINLGRGQGKTTRLLYASEFNDVPILCANKNHKSELVWRAKELGLKIPEPIIVSDLTSNKFMGQEYRRKDILVDEAPYVLQNLIRQLGMDGEVKAITLTSNDLK